jgi:hypothetical protein
VWLFAKNRRLFNRTYTVLPSAFRKFTANYTRIVSCFVGRYYRKCLCYGNRLWYFPFILYNLRTKLMFLYAVFWVIFRLLNFICQRFGTLCVFHLHRQVVMKKFIIIIIIIIIIIKAYISNKTVSTFWCALRSG